MRTTSLTIVLRSLALALPAVAGTLATPVVARAQSEIPAVEPYWVTPTTDDVKIRASHGTLWYAITTVGPSTTLRVDGEIDGWLRVEYPAGTPVVVRSSEAELVADKGVVKLTRRPRLRAWNRDLQFMEECYRSVVIDEVPGPGSEMRFLQAVKNRAGEVAGYLVEAPRGAKGFVLATDVQRTSAPTTTPAPAPTPVSASAPAPVEQAPVQQPPPAPAPQPAPEPAPAPAPVVQQPVVEPTPTPAPQPEPQPVMQPPVSTPAPVEQAPVQQPPVQAPPVEQPVSQPAPTIEMTQPPPEAAPPEAAPAPVVVTPPAPTRVWTLSELDAKFDEVAAQPVEVAEYEQLINEYQRYASSLPRSTAYNRERQYVDARIELLRLKQQLRSSKSELSNLQVTTDQAIAAATGSIDRIERTRDYLVVGRLMPSSIYDGKRLPLMYRVQAAEGGRTLAYVAPDPALGLDTKLGLIVGVKGKGSLDPSARVNIIQATALDILDPNTGLPTGTGTVNPMPAPAFGSTPTTTMPPPASTNVPAGTTPPGTRPFAPPPPAPGQMLPPRPAGSAPMK